MGSSRQIAGSVSTVGGAAWNADDVIVFPLSPGGLSRVSAQGGTVTAVTTGEGSHFWPQFLEDGDHFDLRRQPSAENLPRFAQERHVDEGRSDDLSNAGLGSGARAGICVLRSGLRLVQPGGLTKRVSSLLVSRFTSWTACLSPVLVARRSRSQRRVCWPIGRIRWGRRRSCNGSIGLAARPSPLPHRRSILASTWRGTGNSCIPDRAERDRRCVEKRHRRRL